MRRTFRGRSVPRPSMPLVYARAQRARVPRSVESARARFPIAQSCPTSPTTIAPLLSPCLSLYHSYFILNTFIMSDAFTEFEHEGWERVANKYDSVWSSSTRQFIPPLLDAADVSGTMSVLDVGCGPGYVSAAAAERGAISIGLDFSAEM